MPEEKEVVEQTQETSSEVTATVIEVQNPTAEEFAGLKEAIEVAMPDVVVKQVQFNFRKGVDKETGVEILRKPVILPVPVPTPQGVAAILKAGGKACELLMEAIEGVVTSAARDLINDDYEMNAATFPADKVAWDYLANLPKATRRGGGIPKETWEAFAEDYVTTMTKYAGKNPEQAANAAKILLSKFQSCKTNEAVLNFMVQQLGIYAEKSENVADFAECVDFLAEKADSFLNVTEEDLLKNL